MLLASTDPRLFHLDWDRLCELLGALVVLSLLVERALAPIFEHRAYLARFGQRGVKEFIAAGLSLAICIGWDFDAVSVILLREKTTFFGKLITALVLAGGSKGSIRLFRDILGFQSTAYAEYQAKRALVAEPDPNPAPPPATVPEGRRRMAKSP